MSLALVDTSAWSRWSQPWVGRLLSQAVAANELAVTLPIVLELLWSARDAGELREDGALYDSLVQLHVTSAVGVRARQVQVALAEQGHHRGPSPTDLIAAAAAELAGAELWHCDRHFELIGQVTGQPMRNVGR